LIETRTPVTVFYVPDRFTFNPGDTATKSEIHDRLGGSLQWAMTSCLEGSEFLLFYDPLESRANSYDLWEGDQPDGSFWYVGQGRAGDQSLTKSNLRLLESSNSGRPIHFFRRPAIGTPRAPGNPYTYIGQVSLGNPKYWERIAPGVDGQERKVLVFNLIPVDSSPTGPEQSVTITPAQGVYGLFKSFAYTPWQALGEFIDNSVSSWLRSEQRVPLEVKITWDPDWGDSDKPGLLTISDNAMGISLSDFPRAFELATPPTDLSALNQFGVGLKVAACWFGDQWTVDTSAFGESVRRQVHFNVSEIVEKDLRTLEIREQPESVTSCGTTISISQLHHAPSHPKTIAKIKKYLPKLFRSFLNSGQMSISWNGELLHYEIPGTLTSPSYKDPSGPPVCWEKEFEIEARTGIWVQCVAKVFDSFSRQDTGLNYMWRGRLIHGNVEPFYRPQVLFGNVNSFRTGRLYVEVDASGLNVTSDKTSIDFGTSGIREEDFLKALQAELSRKDFPLLQHAENYRSTKPSPDLRPRIKGTFGQVTDEAEDVGTPFLQDSTIETQVEGTLSGKIPTAEQELIAERVIRHDVGGHQLTFRVFCLYSKPSDPWISIEWESKSTSDHTVFINLAHPFIVRHLTDETLQTIISVGVSLIYGELKAGTLISRDDLCLVRKFTDRFMRLMATNELEVSYDSDNQD
jgi:hypothetical protein